jgi:hypothetical protein
MGYRNRIGRVFVVIVVDSSFFLVREAFKPKDRMTSDAGNAKYILNDAN